MTNRRPVALDHTHEPATESYDGFFSKSDKATLNALASVKNLSVVSHDATLSGDGTAGNALSVVNDGHTHDGRYYTETEVGVLLSGKSDTSHTHDDRYYTEAEIASLLSGKQDTLVSGTNIKTINGSSVLGSGDLAVTAVTDWTQVFDDSGTYRGYKAKSGSSSGYMRTPSEGLLPYESNAAGSGYVGTPAWPFLNMYSKNIYQDGNKVLAQAARGGSSIAGGYYIKLSDGTIIQFARITFSSDSSTAMSGGGGYKTANQTWTFPLAFTSADSYSVSVVPEGIYQISASVQARSATVLTYCCHTVSSDTTSRSRTVHILAIGR